MEQETIDLIEQITSFGELIDTYIINESQTVNNAGDAEVYLFDTNAKGIRQIWEIITWNNAAVSHRPGDKTIKLIDQYSILT